MYNIKISNVEGSCSNISSTKINNICRACLKQEGIISLFGSKYKDLLISDLFTLFSLFQAEEEDGLPQMICQDCSNFVTLFFAFKQMIKENQIILQLVSEITNLDNGFDHPNNNSPNSDLIFDIFNKKVHIGITNDNMYLRLETSDEDNKPLRLENIEINNVNHISLENLDEEYNTLQLDHDYTKICNVEFACPRCFLKFNSRDEFINHRIREAEEQTESIVNIEEFTGDIEEFTGDIEEFTENMEEFTGSIEEFTENIEESTGNIEEFIGEIEEFTCQYCNIKFTSESDFLIHMKRKSEKENHQTLPGSEEYNCPKCKLKFNSRIKFLRHRREERRGFAGFLNIKQKRKFEYICSVCNMKFNSRKQYILHRKEEAAKNPKIVTENEFTCPYCPLKFYSKSEYLRHRKEEAKKNSRCPYCKKVIHTSQLDNHLRLIHKKLPPLKCDICKRKFVSSTLFKNHMLAHKDGFFCEICGRKCFTAHALTLHKKSHDREKEVYCEICDKTFKYPYLLKDHLNMHTGEKPFLCSSCGATFSSQAKFHHHTSIYHTDRPFKCKLCENSYDTNEKLLMHIQRHVNEKDNVCHVCGLEFLKKSSLSLHLKYHDQDENVSRGKLKRMRCLSCSKEYNNIGYFQVHIRSHLGESQHLCLFCGKQFYEEDDYNIHSKLHDNKRLKKLHECNICPKIFSSNAKLEGHIMTHTGEKPFQCIQCGNSYQSRTHLKRHLFLHTGVKPFSCKYCEKTFKLKGNCTQHEKTHEGSGDYVCGLCEKSFYTGSSLRKHQQVHMKGH